MKKSQSETEVDDDSLQSLLEAEMGSLSTQRSWASSSGSHGPAGISKQQQKHYESEKSTAWDKKFSKYTQGISSPSSRLLSADSCNPYRYSKISKVERSWYLICNKQQKVGLQCFKHFFQDNPDFIHIFPFHKNCTYDENGKLQFDKQTEAYMGAHAGTVMQLIGTCVAGLTRVEDLVPKLRQIGSTHKKMGLTEIHYALFYRYLVDAIRDEVGESNWDDETENAWGEAFSSIANLIQRPSTRLGTEPLEGWGAAIAIASCYFSIVTPFRLAGFLYGYTSTEYLFDILDFCAALVFALDLCIFFVQYYKTHAVEDSSSSNNNHGNAWLQHCLGWLYRRLEPCIDPYIQTHRMKRWIPWPTHDFYVLMSFPLQCAHQFRPGMGLHWTHLMGLIRICTASRIVHYVHCAENKALFQRKLNEEKQVMIRIVKLILKLCFVIHLSACFWCIVARVEMGAQAREMEPTSFFPNTDLFQSNMTNVWNCYVRAIHWAFVNLAGIGNVESTPMTSLECLVTISIHLVGAIFYAIVTGNIISMIEDASAEDGKIGMDIAKLTSLMDSAHVTATSKERIIKAYMFRNVLTASAPSTSRQANNLNRGYDDVGLDIHDEVLGTLPAYLRSEIALYVRAELIRRREQIFQHCSHQFLIALTSCLSETRALLTGDYLMKQGELYDCDNSVGFVMVESGSLQIRRNEQTIRVLEPGSVVGKGWLLFHHQRFDMKRENGTTTTSSTTFQEITDWCNSDGIADVSIRALSPCTLLTGLTSIEEIGALEQEHTADFSRLRAEAKCAVRKSQKSQRVVGSLTENSGSGELGRSSAGIKGALKAAKHLRTMKSLKRFRSSRRNNIEQIQDDSTVASERQK